MIITSVSDGKYTSVLDPRLSLTGEGVALTCNKADADILIFLVQVHLLSLHGKSVADRQRSQHQCKMARSSIVK